MTVRHVDAYVLRKLLVGQPLNGDLGTVSDRFRAITERLDATPPEQRQQVFDGFLLGTVDQDELVLALANADPNGPAPAIDPPRRFATCADISRMETSVPWVWTGWLPSSRVAGIAAGEGVGKTRFAMDLARRVWHGLPWPDGQAMTLPRESPTLWIAADGQQSELAEALPLLGMPPEAIIFPTSPDDPYGGNSLDDTETLAALEEAIQVHRPAFVVIDSLTYATKSDIGEQCTVARLKESLIALAQTYQVVVILLLHVSKEGQALGRRIRGITRTLIHLECPNSARPENLRLWVEKSYAAKPPALGVIIGANGNTYDSAPPPRPDSPKGGRPPEAKEKVRRFITDALTEQNDRAWSDLSDRWEVEQKGSYSTFKRAVNSMLESGELSSDGGPGTGRQMILHLNDQSPDFTTAEEEVPDDD